MGCCSSKPSPKGPRTQAPKQSTKSVTITCLYSNSPVVFTTVNISALRDGIRKQFPALLFRAFHLELDGKEVASAQDIRREAEGRNNKLTLTVVTETPVELGTDWEKVAMGVVMVVQGEIVVGTGLLLSADIVLCAIENLDDSLRKGELHCIQLSSPDAKTPLRRDGICVLLATRDRLQVAVVQLQCPQTTGTPVPATIAKSHEDAKALFFTRQRPVLQAEAIALVAGKQEDVLQSEKTLREGANGAPVFNASQELIGVYANLPEESAGVVFAAGSLLATLRKLLPSLKDHDRELVSPLLTEVETEESVDVAAVHKDATLAHKEPAHQEAPQPFDSSSSPVHAEEVEVQLQDPAQEAVFEMKSPFFSISLKENSLLQFNQTGELMGKHRFPVYLASGYNAVLTPKGLVIVACDSNVKMTAFLFTDSLSPLRAPLWTHQFHCGVWHNSKVMVISGLNNEAVEAFCFKENYWSQLANLPKARANSSAVSVAEAVFVFGGVGRNLKRYKKSVFVYRDEVWKKLPHPLPLKLRNCGALWHNDFVLVFGGVKRSKDDTITGQSMLELDLANGNVRDVGKQEIGLFGGFTAGEVNGKFAICSDSGQVFEFQRNQLKFRLVHSN